MNKVKPFKNLVSKKDWREFKGWIKENKAFFSDCNFYSYIFNFISNQEMDKCFWEFLLFDNLKLGNSYQLDRRYLNSDKKYLFATKEKTFIVKMIWDLFRFYNPKSADRFKILDFFLINLVHYLETDDKNFEIEFSLSQDYGLFLEFLVKNHILNYNNLVIFLNKHIYQIQKGFK